MERADVLKELMQSAPEDTKGKRTSAAVIKNAKGHLGYYIKDENGSLSIVWFSLHPLSLSKFVYKKTTEYIHNPSYEGW